MPSSRVEATLLVESQASGETTANTYFARLEHFQNARVIDRDLATPPGSPAEGDTYIVAASPTGAWAGKAGYLAAYFNGWIFCAPKGGFVCFVVDEKVPLMYSSVESLWFPLIDQWSATEHWTGKYRGSSKVYSKTFTFSAIAVGLTAQAHSISGLVLTEAITTQSALIAGPLSIVASGIASVLTFGFYFDATNIVLDYSGPESGSGYDIKVRVEYCR